jgi:ubiquinone/menaquinone biosynthesis C-methylase UbiE
MKHAEPESDPTLRYYANHAAEYFARTRNIDLTPIYGPFLERLSEGSSILDLGCGSGRDACHFAARGHWVAALDPCPQLLALAMGQTPHARRGRIQYLMARVPGMPFADAVFDAVWACASLLHLPRDIMPRALAECRRILRPGGILFLGVKEHDSSTQKDERLFVFWKAEELRRIMTGAALEAVSIQQRGSLDGRPALWLDALATV